MVLGGADKLNLEIIKHINSRYRISVITTEVSKNEWKEKFEEYTQEIYDISEYSIEKSKEFIIDYIKNKFVDIIFISNSYRGYHFLPIIKKVFPRIKIIDYVHAADMNWKAGGWGRISSIFDMYIDITFTCNEYTRRIMIENWKKNEKKIETVYIGVDEKYFDPNKILKGAVRNKFGLGQKKIVLYPCRLSQEKRPDLMLKIAEKIEKKRDDVVFLSVGQGIMLENLERRVKEKKLEQMVFFLGEYNDLRPFYRDANVTLICSSLEGLALTAYESLSMGVPVVSSDVGGQSELIDNQVGILISCDRKLGEVELYVQAIEKIIDNDDFAQSCSTIGRRRIEEAYSIDNMIKRLVKEFEEKSISISEENASIMFPEYFLQLFIELEEEQKKNKAIWEGKEWLEKQYQSQKKYIDEISQGKEWLEAQYQSQKQYIDEILIGKDWLERQYQNSIQVNAENEKEIGVLKSENAILEQNQLELKNEISKLNYKLNQLTNDKVIQKIIKMKKYQI